MNARYLVLVFEHLELKIIYVWTAIFNYPFSFQVQNGIGCCFTYTKNDVRVDHAGFNQRK